MVTTVRSSGASMTLYSVRPGLSWTLVEAGTPDEARRAVALRFGVLAREEIWRDWTVREATKEDVERFGALADVQRGKTKDGLKREATVTKLRRNHPSLFDGGDAA